MAQEGRPPHEPRRLGRGGLTDTVQARRALRLAAEDLAEAAELELVTRARVYRPGLTEKAAARTLKRMVREGELGYVAGIYQNRQSEPARRPRELPVAIEATSGSVSS